MSNKKMISLNILFNLSSFVITFLISFFVTPYVTNNVGMEAYGLIGLANNFTGYITIITTALNSMASRFIVLEMNKKNNEEANKFFNSTFLANLLFAIVILVLTVIFIPNLDKVLNISDYLVEDAKMTFLLVFITFIISLVMSTFGIVYYASGKLYVGAGKTILMEIVRAGVILLIFNYIGVKIQYTVLALLISTILTVSFDMFYMKHMYPEIKVNLKQFELKKIYEMVKAGIWNSISKLSQILLNGLDLIITNLFIGGSILGCVSVAKTFANIIISLIATVSDTFYPKFLKSYAVDKENLNSEFYSSTKVLGYFSCLVIGLFIIYCEDFYILWLPAENSKMLVNLTYISLLPIFISGPIYSMFSLYTVVNKVKPQAVSNLIMSILSTFTVFALLKTTDFGVYAIVGVSAVYGTIKNLTYNMYCLKEYLNISVWKCYVIVLKNIVTMVVIFIVLSFIKKAFVISNFLYLFEHILIGAAVVTIVYFILNTSKQDKKNIFGFLKSKLNF